jgi:uncharacterized protein
MGFSLGGNALLKLLAETAEHAPFLAAAVVSAPFDLLACAQALDAPWGGCGLYRRNFLLTLKRKALAKLTAHPGHGLDAERVRHAQTLQEFDDAFTGPSNGYRGALDYYQRCSSGPVLKEVRRPTLLLNAADDPMIPGRSLPASGGESPWLTVLRTEAGGHVGFLEGSVLSPRFWAERQAVQFLAAQLAS